MNITAMPDFILILWMAIVLATLRRKREGRFMHLWVAGLGMIVTEGIARMLYLQHPSGRQHILSHVVALDAYFLAGIAFFQSATERLRVMERPYLHLTICAVPYLLLLSGYGAGCTAPGFFIKVALLGLICGIFAAQFLAKSFRDLLCHTAIWLPILAFCMAGQYRYAVYYALFAVFAAIAIIFFYALPAKGWGRMILIGGFGIWSLCFLSHPWVETSHREWTPLAEKIWDLQKFVVTFGLLILTLEEAGAANEYDALHDTLTGLPNRRLFVDRLQQDLARARRGKSRVILFNIDLDHFKQVNDSWGHPTGDLLLKEVARRLRTVTRETDTLARVGGDEFYLIVNDASRPSSSDAAGDLPSYLMEVLRSNVEVEPCAFDFHEAHIHLHPRMSIGHAVFPEQAGNIDSLCSIADARMYENKRSRQASGASTISSGVASASSVVAAAGTARDSAKISHRMAAPSSH